MNWKQKAKSKLFWVGIVSSTLIAVQVIAPLFGYNVSDDLGKEITGGIDAILIVFVKLGIINDTTPSENSYK